MLKAYFIDRLFIIKIKNGIIYFIKERRVRRKE
jgi:hypothetical protein